MTANVINVDVNLRNNATNGLRQFQQRLASADAVVASLQSHFTELGRAQHAAIESAEKAMNAVGEAGDKQKIKFFTLKEQIGEVFKGLEAGAFQTVLKFDFLFEQASLSFQTFHKSASAGLEDFLVVAFRNNTDKAEAQWKVFVKSLETAYLKMLAKIASAAIQENLLKPALAVAA